LRAGKSVNGANHGLFGGAIKALRSRRTKSPGLAFPASFSLVHFFWRSKRNEQKKNLGQTKEPERSGARRRQMNKKMVCE
jgi:hypothetical protein